MEKQRNKSISKSCRRLLIFIFTAIILNSSLYAQNLTAGEINQLRISPGEDQIMFTKTDIRFEVLIPRVKSSQVQVLSSQLPSDIILKTVRKLEDYENDGTKIELWYSFEKKGHYQLPALPVMIQNRRRNLRFIPITVDDDPAKQSPRVVVKFSNGVSFASNDEGHGRVLYDAKVGQKQQFTVYVQYISHVVQFSWDIPKDSIFTQTEEFDITEVKYREKNYTHDLIPVASFEWTGLKTGPLDMVKLKTVVTDYNGYRSEIFLPACKINFTENSKATTTVEDKIFDSAFFQGNNFDDTSNQTSITEEDCQKLAELYSLEQNSLLNYSQKHRERIDFENSLGLPTTSYGNNYMAYIHVVAIICLVLLVLLILFIKKKNKFAILIFSVLFSLSLVPLVNLLVKKTDTYAICKGTTIRSVPEEKAEAISEIGAGNKVHITEKAGKWIYIDFGETGGWCLKDTVIIIK